MTKREIHPAAERRWRLSACAGKARYDDGGKANRVLLRLNPRNQVMTYRCPHCGGWHIGGRGGKRLDKR